MRISHFLSDKYSLKTGLSCNQSNLLHPLVKQSWRDAIFSRIYDSFVCLEGAMRYPAID